MKQIKICGFLSASGKVKRYLDVDGFREREFNSLRDLKEHYNLIDVSKTDEKEWAVSSRGNQYDWFIYTALMPQPPQEEMMKGEGFTQGEWEITETESGSLAIAENSDHSIICVLAEWRKERKANARLICQAPAMYRLLKSFIEVCDALKGSIPAALKQEREEAKTILNRINNH